MVPGMNRITVLLVDDHAIVRQGLRALLELYGDFDVVGEADNGSDAIKIAKHTQPDVVLMDVVMPGLNASDATRQILKVASGTKVLVLSCYSDDAYVDQMLGAGAAGYMLKLDAADNLIQAIRKVRQGHNVLSPAIAKRRRGKSEAAPSIGMAELTVREVEVLQLIAEGFTNPQIAAELEISIKTVEKHRQKVMDKLNIHKIAGLTRFYFAHHMREPSELARAGFEEPKRPSAIK
jgi:DNA-binding NarL/FixJ family response regulator